MSNNGKFTADEYKRMEKFLGCDRPDYRERYEEMVRRRNQKYGIQDNQELDETVDEALKTWEFLFKKESK